MSQVIKVSPSTAVTSERNNSIDENNRNDTDSERGATTKRPIVSKFDVPNKRMQWRDWKEKFGKKRPAYNIIKNNLNKKLKIFLENNHIKLYNRKFFIENKLNPLIYALPKFWSRFSFSDTKIAKKVRSTVVAVRVVCVKFVQW